MTPLTLARLRVSRNSILLLLLFLFLGLFAWVLQRDHGQGRLNQDNELDRRVSEYALIVEGRLHAVLSSAQFAAARLRRDDVRQQVFCPAFLRDLVASQTAIIGGAVSAGSSRRLCDAGQVPDAAAAPMAPDSWRLRAQPDGSLQMDTHRSAGVATEGVLLSLRLDAAALTAGLERAVELSWVPGVAEPATGPRTQAVRVDGQVVALLRARALPDGQSPALNMPAVGAALLASAVLTAMGLMWLNRRRPRGESQPLMRIALPPQERDVLSSRMRDSDPAPAAQVVEQEQRQSFALSEQLAQTNKRLEEVQRAASVGSWRLDLASERIDWSDQTYEIFGLPRGEVFGLERLISRVHAADRALLIEKQRALATGQADLDLVYRIERAGGEERVVHSRGTVATRDAAGRPTALVGTVQDVTEAWEASGMSDALARALALSADPVLMTREHAGIWLWAWSNRAWERLCEQLQIEGREAHHQLFHPAVGLLRAHAERVCEARAQCKVLRLDLEVASTEGAQWLEAELIPQVGAPGRAGHGLLLLRDRTAERRGAEALRNANASLERVVGERTAALARSEQQYRVLADLSPQILWQADREGRVSYLNRAWHELVGARDDGWLGLRWMEALHTDDVAAAQAAIAEGLQSGRPWQARRRVRGHTGAYRSLLGVAAPVVGADGTVEGWVGVEADITELEQHAARLQQLNAELETFSYTVSHDLRAPVHVIKGFVDALLEGQVGQIDEQARSYLKRVLRSARRMDELIADLLALAKLSRETLQRSRFDVGALARNLLQTVRDRYPERIIEFRVHGGNLAIEADRRLFTVTLENLLDNAAKFTAGRPVCRIDLVWRIEHEQLVLDLADNGVGFPSESAHRLFRPFQRLHAQSQFTGHGIGLATVARIVQIHGGSITAHNREQGGVVFSIRLPRQMHVAETGHADLQVAETG